MPTATKSAHRLRARIITAVCCGSAPLLLSALASAGTVNVNSADDGFTSQCTLRRAVRAVNAGTNDGACLGATPGSNTILLGGVATIDLNPGTHGTITITREDTTIQGNGHLDTVIQRSAADLGNGIPTFKISATSRIAGVTLQKFRGHVIRVDAERNLSVYQVRFLNNNETFTSMGGCIYNAGRLSISDSEFDGCSGTTGAALQNRGSAWVTNTTFVRGQAERGGAIFNSGTLDLNACTLARNSSTVYGGAIQNTNGSVTISHSTIAFNVSSLRGSASCASSRTACSAVQNFSPGTLSVFGSVIARNTAVGQDQPNCLGTVQSGGSNLLGESNARACAVTGGGHDLPPAEPLLAPGSGDLPGNFGGVGKLYIPAANSPLLNQIGGCFERDQRGVRRNATGLCDVGAGERAETLLVVGSTTLSAGDVRLRDTLIRLGLQPVIQTGAASTAAAATGKVAVIISDSNSAASVNSKFLNVDAGVMVLKPTLFDDMKMTGLVSGTSFGSSNTNAVVVGGCDLRLGFSGTATTTSSSAAHGWGVPAAGAQICATVAANRAGLFAYPQWGSLWDGSFAAGTRVGLFATNTAAAVLESDGIRLLEEAIIMTARGF